jgi:hypothetical protein
VSCGRWRELPHKDIEAKIVMGRFGAAILILVVTLSVWNAMEYHRRMHVYVPPEWSTQHANEIMAERQRNVAPIYIQREVLILGVGFAALVLLKGRKS